MAKSSGASSSTLKWCVLGFSFVIALSGAIIVAASLRLLFDPAFSHLLFQNGAYSGGQILAGFGALMLIAGIIGCIAALVENPCLLSTFLAFLVIFVVAEITAGVVAYANLADFQERVHFNFLWTVQRHYGQDVVNTTILDLVQETWKCCGSTGYSSWSNSAYGRGQTSRELLSTSKAYLVPKSCCVDPNSEACERVYIEGIRSNNQQDNMNGTLFREGCGNKLVSVTSTYSYYFFGLGSGLVLLQIIAVILVSVQIWSIKANASRFPKKSYYPSGSMAASQAMLDQQSDSHKSSPSFAGSRSPSLDLDQQSPPPATYPTVSSLV